MTVRITPSILNADFADMGREVGRIESADGVHIDVMDNHFVPNLTMGVPMVEALRKVSDLPFDAHLMIEDPDVWAPGYVDAGAQTVTSAVRGQLRDSTTRAEAMSLILNG